MGGGCLSIERGPCGGADPIQALVEVLTTERASPVHMNLYTCKVTGWGSFYWGLGLGLGLGVRG